LRFFGKNKKKKKKTEVSESGHWSGGFSLPIFYSLLGSHPPPLATVVLGRRPTSYSRRSARFLGPGLNQFACRKPRRIFAEAVLHLLLERQSPEKCRLVLDTLRPKSLQQSPCQSAAGSEFGARPRTFGRLLRTRVGRVPLHPYERLPCGTMGGDHIRQPRCQDASGESNRSMRDSRDRLGTPSPPHEACLIVTADHCNADLTWSSGCTGETVKPMSADELRNDYMTAHLLSRSNSFVAVLFFGEPGGSSAVRADLPWRLDSAKCGSPPRLATSARLSHAAPPGNVIPAELARVARPS